MRQARSHTRYNSLRDHMILTRTAPIPDFIDTFNNQTLLLDVFTSTNLVIIFRLNTNIFVVNNMNTSKSIGQYH